MNKYFPLDIKEFLAIISPTGFILAVLPRVGVGDRIAVACAFATFACVTVTWAIARIWQREGDRFRLVFEKHGEAALTAIDESRESILATHFGTLVPSQTYITHMTEKLDQGIHMVRIVGADRARDEKTQKWLASFRGKESYTEYEYKEVVLPFDFTVYDSRTLFIYLPGQAGREFNRALIFKNPELALIFRGIFERIRQNSQPIDVKQIESLSDRSSASRFTPDPPGSATH